MARLFRNKLFIGIICIVLAAAVAFLLLPQFFESQAATETVIRVKQDIPAGTTITSAMITNAEVGAFGLSEKVIRAGAEVVGMVAAENLYSGEYLIENRVVAAADYKSQTDARTKGIGNGICLITVEFPSSSAGIAGALRAGNTVDVYEYTETEDEEGETIKSAGKVITGLYVYDVMNSSLDSLDDIDALKAQLPEGDTTSFDFAPAYVIFRCTQSQAKTLICLERNNSMHLTLTKAEG